MDAYRHLTESPASLRDAAHSVALKACGAALRSEIEPDTAQVEDKALDAHGANTNIDDIQADLRQLGTTTEPTECANYFRNA